MNNPYNITMPIGCKAVPMDVVQAPYSTAWLSSGVMLHDARALPMWGMFEAALAATADVQADNKTIYGVVGYLGRNIVWFRFHDSWVKIATGYEAFHWLESTGTASRRFRGSEANVKFVTSRINKAIERQNVEVKGLTQPKAFHEVLATGVDMPRFDSFESYNGQSLVPNWLHPLHPELADACDFDIFDVYTSRAAFKARYRPSMGPAFQFTDSIVVKRSDRNFGDYIKDLAAQVGR